MKDLEQAEDEWELMKEPEKFATMVVEKCCGSGTGARTFGANSAECHEKGIRVYEENGKHYEELTAQIQKHEKLKTLIQKVTREAP